MNLFIIRNLMNVIIAEEIIKNNQKEKFIAFIVKNNIENYFQKIKNTMNIYLWEEIKENPFNWNIQMKSYKTLANYHKILDNYYKKIKIMLRDNKIKKVFFSNLLDYSEKLIYKAAKDLNLDVNLYEEGLNLYFPIRLNKSKIFVKKMLAPKYRNIYNVDRMDFDNVYCIFPDKYKFNNVKNKTKVNLNFELNKEEEETLSHLNIEFLFLSNPLSEDNLISKDQEIENLRNFLKEYPNKKIYFKFHPRESKEKIDYLKKNFQIKEIPKNIRKYSAEKIVFNSSIKNLIGYETGTLAYASELTNVKVYSLLKRIKKGSKHLESFYELYSKEFKKIEYI